MNRLTVFAACAMSCLIVRSADVTIDVASGDYTLSDADVAGLLPDNKLVKTGSGRLVIDRDMQEAGFAGDIEVRAGYLRLACTNATGKALTGVLDVLENAAVEIAVGDGIAIQSKTVNVCGAGPDGKGVFRVVGTVNNRVLYSNQQSFNLTGDAMIGCGTQVGFSSAYVNVNGHTLLMDSGTFQGRSVRLHGPGDIVATNGITFYMENDSMKLTSGTAEDTELVMHDGATLKIGGNRPNSPQWAMWSLDFVKDGSIYWLCWSENSDFGWGGPVSLGGDVVLKDNAKAGLTFSITNLVSGSGGFEMKSSSTVNLSNPENTFEGKFVMTGGTTYGGVLNVTGINGVPSARYGGVYGTKGFINFDLSGEESLCDADLLGIWKGVSTNSVIASDVPFNGSTRNVDQRRRYLDFAVDTGADYTFSSELKGPVVVAHGGTGVLTVASAFTGTPDFVNHGGELVLEGNGSRMDGGWVDVFGGTVTIPAGSHFMCDTNAIFAAAEYPEIAKVAVRGRLTTGTDDAALCLARNFIVAPQEAPRGVLEIFDGAVVSNQLGTGNGALVNGWSGESLTRPWGMSAYYHHGGTFTTKGSYGFLADYNCGYYSMEGGLLDIKSIVRTARWGKDLYIVFHQRGGEVRLDGSRIEFGTSGSDAEVCISEGSFLVGNGVEEDGTLTPGTISLCRNDFEEKGGCSMAVFTVDGENAQAVFSQLNWQSAITMASQTNSLAQVNVNAGLLAVNRLHRIHSTDKQGELTDNRAELNFNGGTLKMMPNAARNGISLFYNTFRAGTDRLYVHSGGAVIDTNGRDVSIDIPVEAPGGNGVESIAIPEDMAALKDWTYTGAPRVRIVDPTGSGSGATAIAEFDTTSGKVTAIRVTCRGVNYGEGTYAVIAKGGTRLEFTGTCTLTPNSVGPFTKQGEGTLFFSNTVACTAISLEGGTVDIGERSVADMDFTSIKLLGGAFANDSGDISIPEGTWKIDLADVKSGKQCVIPAGTGLPSSVELLNGELAEKEVGKYVLYTLPGGFEGARPEVEGVPFGWHAFHKGDVTYLKRNHAFRLIVR